VKGAAVAETHELLMEDLDRDGIGTKTRPASRCRAPDQTICATGACEEPPRPMTYRIRSPAETARRTFGVRDGAQDAACLFSQPQPLYLP
jgi:hypothetical protein